MTTQALVNGRWIPARRYKRPDEYTLWERIAFWRDLPLVSQETADAEYAKEIHQRGCPACGSPYSYPLCKCHK